MRRAASSPAPAPARRSVILTYHSVGARDHEMNVTPADFAEQMRWLADHREVIPVARAASGDAGVAITFDDGYRDNLTEAAAILDRWPLAAAVFAVPGRMGEHLDHDDPRDDTARLMTWDELGELARQGWTVGGHTMTHCRLALTGEATQRMEIAECKRAIESRIGVAVEGFAYPFGSALDYSPTSVRLAREAGYTYALSNRFGANTAESDRFELRRIWIDRSDSLASFAAKVEGRLDRLAWLDSPAGIRARRWANRLLHSA
jgi:peptidoglycan/xylan/chitin deacetylase (PgdA/CDA1 family)